MPAYAYQCTKCAGTLLDVRPITAPDTAPTCQLCGSATRRVFQLAGVTFKGDGWGKDAK